MYTITTVIECTELWHLLDCLQHAKVREMVLEYGQLHILVPPQLLILRGKQEPLSQANIMSVS